MPDSQGKLTDFETSQVRKWIQEKSHGVLICPVSEDSDWQVGTHLVNVSRFTPGSVMIGGITYPFVMLICQNCGYTHFFNAVKIGVSEPASREAVGG
tara:strand:- start:316 stop:606 length:291 start_codon:yes stop_codon:yes gene_type:complete